MTTEDPAQSEPPKLGTRVLAVCHKIGEQYAANPNLLSERFSASLFHTTESASTDVITPDTFITAQQLSYPDEILSPEERELQAFIKKSQVSDGYKEYLDRMLFSHDYPNHLVKGLTSWEAIPALFLGIREENDTGIWNSNMENLEALEILRFFYIDVIRYQQIQQQMIKLHQVIAGSIRDRGKAIGEVDGSATPTHIREFLQMWAASFEECYHEAITAAAVRHFDFASKEEYRKHLDYVRELLGQFE